jgi:ATP-dependent Zn protease
MVSQQSHSIERLAYQEAGHAVMSYLIRKGFTEKYVPIDRSLILPTFKKVAINGESADWGEITFGLGSLITTAQVLLAGNASEQIKFGTRNDMPAPEAASVKRAEHLTAAYIEEYAGEGMGFSERDERTNELVHEMSKFVDEILRTHWASVEALATALLEHRSLSENQAFGIIERDIPEDAKGRAKAFAARDPKEALAALLKKMSNERDSS